MQCREVFLKKTDLLIAIKGKDGNNGGAECSKDDDSIPLLQFSYNAIYDENGTYTGEGNTEYYYMGENTDETFYQEMLASLKASSSSR